MHLCVYSRTKQNLLIMADIYYPMLSKTGNESTIAFVNKVKHAVLQYYTSHGHKISKNKTDEVNYLCNTYVLMNTLYEDEQAFIDGLLCGLSNILKMTNDVKVSVINGQTRSVEQRHGKLRKKV